MSVITLGDRTGTTYTGGEDQLLKEAAPTTPQHPGEALEANKFDTGDFNHSLIRFPALGNLGSKAISAATLYLYVQATDGADYTINVHRMLRPWVESTATWNTYDGSNNWTTAGALSDGNDRSGTISAAWLSSGTNLNSFVAISGAQFLADVQAMAAGTFPNYGWGTYPGSDAPGAAYRQYSSSDHSTPAQRLYLELTIEDVHWNLRTKVNRPRPFAPGRAR